jgi:hypothetical protein
MLMVVPPALLLNRSTRAAHAQQTAVQLALVLQVRQMSAKSNANRLARVPLLQLRLKSAQTLVTAWRSWALGRLFQTAQLARHLAPLLR